jgi:hypothetical protein
MTMRTSASARIDGKRSNDARGTGCIDRSSSIRVAVKRSRIADGGTGGATTLARAPVAVAGGIAWRSVSGGGIATATSQTCGVATDGRAWCWGSNALGQLGRPGGGSPVPVLVNGPAS